MKRSLVLACFWITTPALGDSFAVGPPELVPGPSSTYISSDGQLMLVNDWTGYPGNGPRVTARIRNAGGWDPIVPQLQPDTSGGYLSPNQDILLCNTPGQVMAWAFGSLGNWSQPVPIPGLPNGDDPAFNGREV